jgi:hypothetical protein
VSRVYRFFYSSFVNESTAFATGLAYVTPNNEVIMQGDNTSTLALGEYRNRLVATLHSQCQQFIFSSYFPSVRINSQAQYNTGLFVLDLNRAPWGCSKFVFLTERLLARHLYPGVWPAFWTVGSGTWPYVGACPF